MAPSWREMERGGNVERNTKGAGGNADPGDEQMVPSFSTFNSAGCMFLTGLIILAVWYSNTWNTGYLPINSNRIYDHFGKLYNVSAILDDRGLLDVEKYKRYSAPYMSAANIMVYGFFFAIYSAVITHVILYHRFEVMMGFKNLWNGLRAPSWAKKACAVLRRKQAAPTVTPARPDAHEQRARGEYMDVHNRLMSVYPEGMSTSAVLLFVWPPGLCLCPAHDAS